MTQRRPRVHYDQPALPGIDVNGPAALRLMHKRHGEGPRGASCISCFHCFTVGNGRIQAQRCHKAPEGFETVPWPSSGPACGLYDPRQNVRVIK